MSEGPEQIRGVYRSQLERMLELMATRIRTVMTAHRYAEEHARIYNRIGRNNLTEALSHLAGLAEEAEKLTEAQQQDELTNFEDHLRRTMMESFEVVAKARLGTLKKDGIWDRYYTTETPLSPVNVLSDNVKWGGTATTARPRLTRYELMSVSQDTSASEADPGCGDERRLKKTKTPGVFKRVDGKGKTIGYVCVFRSAGRQRKRHARTYEEARRIKRESETDRDRGELQERTTITLLSYLDEWVERYRGQGRRGFRENTRDEYRRLIAAYAHPYFSGKLKLAELTTFQLARFLDWLADEEEQGRSLSDRTIANAVMPLRAALATAKREGLIRHNPAQGLALPRREQIPEEEVKVISREQLAAVLAMAPERHRLFFELLAATGLRISEVIALQRLHFQLEDGEPEVCVRRAIVRERIEAPKSKYGRREVRLPAPLAANLRARLTAQPDQDSIALAFPNDSGGPLDPNNLRRRVLKPLVEEVNAPWAGFHTFRHTFASIHLSQGTNLLQLSRALGHHSPAFTLTRYTHLLPGEDAPALDLASDLSRSLSGPL